MPSDIIHIQQPRTADVLSGDLSPKSVSKYFDGKNSPKLPTPDKLEFGEIALNIAKDYEVIAIKNYDGEIVYLPFNVALKLAQTRLELSELSGYTLTSIDELSGATIAIFDSLDDFKAEIWKIINDLVEIYGDFQTLSAYTEHMIEVISGSTVQEKDITDLELVHAAAFKKFREATGVNEEVQYKPEWKYIKNMNMSEAIDYIGETVEDNYNEGVQLKGDVTDNELTTAAAVSRINHSLGFTPNAMFEPESEMLYGMNVTESINTIQGEIDNINDYIDNKSTTDHIRSITYEKLVKLVDNGKLMWGCMYRITNYQATIDNSTRKSLGLRQENVRSGVNTNNGFDIIVTAIDSKTLSENVTFVRNAHNKSFEGCMIEAWQGKYTIYNDTERFSWVSPDGYGVIYFMRDEFGNEAWYDFKDIMIIGQDKKKHFTFEDSETGEDLSLSGRAYGNKILPSLVDNENGSMTRVIPCTRFVGGLVASNCVAVRCFNATLSGNFDSCWVGEAYSGITLEGDFTCRLIGYNII